MDRLSITRLSFACATLLAGLYGASMLIVMTGPRDLVVAFFNSVFHGIDVTPIMRWEMPWWEMLVGITEVFIIGWLCGAALATLYNMPGGKAEK